jgi:hypothetical protein
VTEDADAGFAVVAVLQDGGTRANATLTRGSAGGVHPWHIHERLCSEMGPVVGDADDYPVLRPDASGDASATETRLAQRDQEKPEGM